MAKTFKAKTIRAAIVKYSPILVIDKWRLAKMGASKLKRSLISNWSNGLDMHVWFNMILFTKVKQDNNCLKLVKNKKGYFFFNIKLLIFFK